jgi:hypothetical protein
MKFLKIAGWIFVPYVMILLSWKKMNNRFWKVTGIIWAVLALMFGIFAATGDSSNNQPLAAKPSETTTTVQVQEAKASNSPVATPIPTPNKEDIEKKKQEADKKKQEADKKKMQQQDVIAFEKSVYALEAEIKPYMNNYQKVMNAVGNGDATVYDAYDAASKAKNASEQLSTAYYSLDIPKELPNTVTKLLEGSRTDLATAYYSKSVAMGAVMKFLDDQKPSNMQKYKDEIATSERFILSGVTKILQAKTELGIDIAK